jgi:hypothetical protein
MRKSEWIAIAGILAAAATSTVPVAAQRGGATKLTTTQLRTTFRDAPSDAVRSDGGYYETSSIEKTSNTLTATTAANYMLDTFTSTKGEPIRCLNITPTQVVAQLAGESLPSFGCLAAESTSLSFFSDSTDSLRTMDSIVNSRAVKRMNFGWVADGYEYHLRFNGHSVDLGDGTGPYRLANVGFTCTASDSAGCAAWTAEPIRCDVSATGGPYSALSNCNPSDGKSNSLAVLERRSTRPNSTAVMIAVVDVPFFADIDRRD